MLKLHEAWFEIARRISIGDETWICNAADWLRFEDEISGDTWSQILERVSVEAKRQGCKRGCSLWAGAEPTDDKGRIVRIKFIAAELRRLAGQ